MRLIILLKGRELLLIKNLELKIKNFVGENRENRIKNKEVRINSN